MRRSKLVLKLNRGSDSHGQLGLGLNPAEQKIVSFPKMVKALALKVSRVIFVLLPLSTLNNFCFILEYVDCGSSCCWSFSYIDACENWRVIHMRFE